MTTLLKKKSDDLKSIAVLLDSQFTGPFGLRFGLDGIIGLIPVVGDIITNSFSVYIVLQAASLGCSSATLIRMCVNVIVENIVDAIPLFGQLFDFYWKSNTKNIALLEQHLLNPVSVTFRSKLIVGTMIFFLVSIFVGSALITIYLIKLLLSYF